MDWDSVDERLIKRGAPAEPASGPLKQFLVVADTNVDILICGVTGFSQLGREIESEDMRTVLGGSPQSSLRGLFS